MANSKHVQIRVSTPDKAVFKEAALYDDRSLSNWFVSLANRRLKEIKREQERDEAQRLREEGAYLGQNPTAQVSPTQVAPSTNNGIPVWETRPDLDESHEEVIPGVPKS